MGTNYVSITIAMLTTWLAGLKRQPDARSTNPHQEIWLDWVVRPLAPRIAVRLYTSIVEAHGGTSRAAGKDAIRVCVVVGPVTSAKPVCTLIRVHRTPGWEIRTKDRLTLAWKILAKAPTCPACEAPMIPRLTKAGYFFWSCSMFPACKGASDKGIKGRPTTLEQVLEAAVAKAAEAAAEPSAAPTAQPEPAAPTVLRVNAANAINIALVRTWCSHAPSHEARVVRVLEMAAQVVKGLDREQILNIAQGKAKLVSSNTTPWISYEEVC